MNGYPKVSIVTPSFNQGQFIEETILSVKNQDYPNIEHIVIDGGSTDGTLDILRKYKHLLWVSEPDNGQTQAINKGFRMATGEILNWLNSDDILMPGALMPVLEAFRRFKYIDFVFGDTKVIDYDGNVLFVRKEVPFTRNMLLYGANVFCQPSSFFRRRVLDALGYLNENLHYMMDYEFWTRCMFGEVSFYHIPQVLSGFRLYSCSKTGSQHRNQLKEQRIVLDMYRNFRFPWQWADNLWIKILRYTYRSKKIFLKIIIQHDFQVFGFMLFYLLKKDKNHSDNPAGLIK